MANNNLILITFSILLLTLISGCMEDDVIRLTRAGEGTDILNNTNLAPTFPGETTGTGERVIGTTYYTNNSRIEIFVWGHALSAGDVAEIHLFINGTKVGDTSNRPLGAAEQSNTSIIAIIPRYANYSIEMNNYHHYEWREYIISGGTGDIDINYYNNTTGSSGTLNHSNLTNLNWADANHTIDTAVNFSNNSALWLNNVEAFNFLYLANKSLPSDYDKPQWHLYTQSENNSNVIFMRTSNSNFTYSTNFFGGARSGGNLSYPTATLNNYVFFYFYGIGHNGTQWRSASTNPNIQLRADGDWNATWNPTKIMMAVSNTTSATFRFILNATGNLQLSAYGGHGNVYACFDNDGNLYAGSPGC